jgi:hypothetical protein
VNGLELRYTVSKDVDARVHWSRRPDRSEAVLAINAYF